MKAIFSARAVLPIIGGIFFCSQSAYADGCAPGQACYEDPAPAAQAAPEPETVVIPPAAKGEPEAEPVAMVDPDGTNFGIYPFFGIHDYDCPEEAPGFGLLATFQPDGLPVAFGIGGSWSDFEIDFVGGDQFDFDGDLWRFPLWVEYPIEVHDYVTLAPKAGIDLFVLSSLSDGIGSGADIGYHTGLRVDVEPVDNYGLFVGADYVVSDPNVDDTPLSGDMSIDLDGFIYMAGVFAKF